jgi:hypothetical protein
MAEPVTWSQPVAGRRKFRPLGGAAPVTVFHALEAAELLPLPQTPCVLARWSTGTVGPAIHIKTGVVATTRERPTTGMVGPEGLILCDVAWRPVVVGYTEVHLAGGEHSPDVARRRLFE